MPYIRKLPSGKWQATVKHPSGDRYTKTDPLKRVVSDWAAELEQSIRRGDFVDPNAGKTTLAEWWTKWLTTRTVSRATASKNESHWRVHVEPAFGSWPLASIQPWDVEAWVARTAKEADGTKGAEARATALRLLRQLLEAAVAHRMIRSNPAGSVKAPTPPKHVDRFLDIEEADRLLAAIQMPEPVRKGQRRDQKRPRVPDPANRLLVKLMLDAGLRWQEAAGLHVFRVDLKRRKQLRVQEVVERGTRVIKVQPKSEAGARVVPLTDELVKEITAYLEDHPTKDGLLFPAPDGGTLDYRNWLKRVWDPAVARAGLADPQPTPHDCRHSYGSWLADHDVPPHQIRDLMGHGSLRAAERYIHASKARMQSARDALGARRAHEGESQQGKSPSPSGGNGV